MRECKAKLKARPTGGTTKQTLYPIIRDNIMIGFTIYTEDNPSDAGAYKKHKIVNHSAKESMDGIAHTNGIESIRTVAKGFGGKRSTYKELIG